MSFAWLCITANVGRISVVCLYVASDFDYCRERLSCSIFRNEGVFAWPD
jgi:hypothetical protein